MVKTQMISFDLPTSLPGTEDFQPQNTMGACVYLVAVVAGVLLLAAVPGDVAGTVALVTTILLLTALPSKVAKPKGDR